MALLLSISVNFSTRFSQVRCKLANSQLRCQVRKLKLHCGYSGIVIKIAASNENIECFHEYFAVGYRAPDPSFLKSSCTGQDKKISHLEYQ